MAVNNIVQSVSTLIGQVKDSLQSSVIQANRNTPDSEQLEFQINKVFEHFDAPFQNLETTSLQRRYINSNMNCIALTEYKHGQMIAYRKQSLNEADVCKR